MEPDTSLDAIVIGAGFAGIYALHKLRNELGLAVRCFDKADGVGGTWHWNRYPGAKSDSEGFVYRYSFDKEMLQQWSWTNRYLEQAEVLEYLNAVVDRHDLRRDIQLETAVTSVRWDDSLARWEVRTDSSKVYRSKYLITALGVLSEPNTPEIPGIEQFSGQVVHTSRWPEGLDPNSVFTNLPPGIETQVEWITELIRQAETRGSAVVEVSETAVRAWAQLCDDIANASLFPKAHSWIFGANIPGKTSRALFYFAGLGNYRRVLADESDADYPNFTFHSDDHTSLEREHASIPQ